MSAVTLTRATALSWPDVERIRCTTCLIEGPAIFSALIIIATRYVIRSSVVYVGASIAIKGHMLGLAHVLWTAEDYF